jgi:C4-dicarboxylate transporter DctM subunit
MTETLLVLFGTFFVLLFLGAPIAVALAISSLVAFWAFDLPIQAMAQVVYASTGKFGLLAIPLFVLAGVIMERCGISERLVRLANLIFGPIPGNLAMVTVAVGIIFVGISGSGPADTAALGAILIPAMVSRKYRPAFAAGLLSSVGSIAIIVPPSIGFIIYGVLAEVSISKLFLAGILPGLLMGLVLAGLSLYEARRHNYPTDRIGSPGEIWRAFADAFWGLMAPVIILGGIYGGVFTPTEAAGVAVVYGLLVGLVIYRSLSLKDLVRLARDAAVASAVVMFVVAMAGLFAWIIVARGVAAQLSETLTAVATTPAFFLILANVALIVAGMFLDAVSIYYITVPILVPVAKRLGIDPIHFGVIMTMNLAIGQFTPPVGVNLFVATGIARIPLKDVAAAIWPFVVVSVVALAIVSAFPQLSLLIPSMMAK